MTPRPVLIFDTEPCVGPFLNPDGSISWSGEANVEAVTELLLQRYGVTSEMIEAAQVSHADFRARMAELKRETLAALYRQLEDLANRALIPPRTA